MDPDLLALQRRLHHTFKIPQLLTQAVTHRSFSADHNERLEFLGDAVLNLAVGALLYEQLRDLPEGDLSRVRANLVKQDTLHLLALDLSIAGCIRFGEGELRSGGRERPSILADALEAVIGAVYLDGGHDAALSLVRRLYSAVEIRPEMQAAEKDPKTGLQEWLQGRKMPLPAYRIAATRGAAHQQKFEVECEVADLGLLSRGAGASRRAGEQAAAAAMLEQLRSRSKDERSR